MVADLIGLISIQWFLLSALIFFVGYLAAYPVWKLEIKLLIKYPVWVWGWVKRKIGPDDHWMKMFLFIFLFNSFSLLVNFVSGFLVVLPFILAFFLGLHLGVISMKEFGKISFAMMFLNPVAWLELPASWVSLAIGIDLGLKTLEHGLVLEPFFELLPVYALIVIPLLLIAGSLETALIKKITDEEMKAGSLEELEKEIEDEEKEN
ncbi:stage II sporulation protein M [Methanonatronarchaeum sp. AMET6-2]|uniref:stage II sporulation protein M n=1 Tax=Methanonatronarchaeum sp. AMET6-2 TaxID=2933293 RepID=UPI00120984BA|nr:stage II sporulation protein M [Methanonatronarchaeum sp. AMET6-2]RZN61131.1 MAG: stage II sporulation protein M [Methanonatronarchaeia archaeon]UOY09811.1 stage II sporulation protein M [Methanonatronarchaeum sp. AMET6-2]